jgi:hypothetical protein
MKYVYIFIFFISCKSNTDKKENVEKNNTSNIENKLDTLINNNDYLILGDKFIKVKIINKKEVDNFPSFELLFTYRNDVILVDKVKYDNLKIYRKYQPQKSFNDYQVDIYNGKLADPDFSSNPDAKLYITRIKDECAKGINFAGHYTLVIWGCGSPCQSGVIIDRKTGKIFGGYDSTLGSEFKKDSKMIIKNIGAIDTKSNLIDVCAFCEVSHEVWTGIEFNEVE